jgi:ribonuclease J
MVTKNKKKLKIIPLGGLGEIGKNMTVFEYGEDLLIVDCGLAFPEEEMLGIDLVIPDISYLQKNKDKVRGVVLTHGHEDHIGGIPYLLKEMKVPIYGSRLTLGLLKNKFEEHGLNGCSISLHIVEAGERIKLGKFEVEFIRSNHSIPDPMALAIHTPLGVVVHTSDFKVDYTPIRGEPIDLARFAELGKKGVLLLLADSTNAEREGYTMSERTVGGALDGIFSKARGRILVATFSSNVHRVQQVVDAAVKHERKVSICGRSMVNVVNVAIELGYLNVPEGIMIDIETIHKYPENRITIITTGSQGEPMSALSRMSSSEHKQVEIIPGDLVIISATPIPGNEKLVSKVINELFRKGAEVIYEYLADIHVSGHACQEELKLIHSLVKPQFFMPVHGEFKHLKQHAKIAHQLGMPMDRIFISEIGRVLELSSDSAKFNGTVPSGNVLVDGLGVGDVGNVVLRDRRLLSQDGIIIVVLTLDSVTGNLVSGPDIVSRGFVYVRESENLMEEARLVVRDAILEQEGRKKSDWNQKKNIIKDVLKDHVYRKTRRRPVILPIIMEV